MEKHAKPQDSEEKKGFSFDPKKSGIIEILYRKSWRHPLRDR